MQRPHQARRTLRNRADGNPFATLLNEMAAAYAKAGPRLAQLLHVEMDALGDPAGPIAGRPISLASVMWGRRARRVHASPL